MNTDTKHHLMHFIQDALGREFVFADVLDASTLRLHSTTEMYPLIEIVDDGVVFTCPLAYYETPEQRLGLLELFGNTRQVWYDEAGWGPYVGECNDPNARIERLPEDIMIQDNPSLCLISATLTFKPDYIFSNPDEFSSAIDTVYGYPVAIRPQICDVIYMNMPKAVTTDPDDPKSYFFCMMLLYYRIHSSVETFPFLAVDWEDVRTSIEMSNELVFYPSLQADSYDGLADEVERTCQKAVSPNEPYGIIATLTLPKSSLYDYGKRLRDRFGTNHVRTHIYAAAEGHPYTAEMVLLKFKENKQDKLI